MGEFDEYFGLSGGLPRPSWDARLECLEPLIDVQDNEDEIVVTADLPCVEHRDHIKLDVSERVLDVSAEIKRRIRWERWGNIQKGVYFSSFKRSIPLPHPVDPGLVKAVFREGVLRISLPKIREKHRVTID